MNRSTAYSHVPVLLKEALEHLNVQKGKKYIDATLGGGGHSREIVNAGGIVLGIDCDPTAMENAENSEWRTQHTGNKVVLGNFRNIRDIAWAKGFEKVNGIIFDLGMSSFEIDESGRGFSFRRDEPLDMRLDLSLGVTAADLLNGLSQKELARILSEYGEERLSSVLSREIVARRRGQPWLKTLELADLVSRVYAQKGICHQKIHPATRTFQALRIAVNDELGALTIALEDSIGLLAKGGRLVVISFHSLEDRIAKSLREDGRLQVVAENVLPPAEEVASNLRSRSAKMRVYEKIT